MSCPNRENPTSYFKEVANAGKTFAVTRFTSSSPCPEYALWSVCDGRKERRILCVHLVHFVHVFTGLVTRVSGRRVKPEQYEYRRFS